jgi:hypothetical protein
MSAKKRKGVLSENATNELGGQNAAQNADLVGDGDNFDLRRQLAAMQAQRLNQFVPRDHDSLRS